MSSHTEVGACGGQMEDGQENRGEHAGKSSQGTRNRLLDSSKNVFEHNAW